MPIKIAIIPKIFYYKLLLRDRFYLLSIKMGGWTGPNPQHTWGEEAWPAYQNQEWAKRYQQWASEALQQIYYELDIERNTLQANAFVRMIQALNQVKEIEWKIFEARIKKAQADYIGNLYTNQIIGEIRNLEDILAK